MKALDPGVKSSEEVDVAKVDLMLKRIWPRKEEWNRPVAEKGKRLTWSFFFLVCSQFELNDRLLLSFGRAKPSILTSCNYLTMLAGSLLLANTVNYSFQWWKWLLI